MNRTYFMQFACLMLGLAALYFAFEFVPSIEAFVISFLLAYLLNPLVQKLRQHRFFPKALSVTIVYIGFISIIVLALFMLIPAAYRQIASLAQNIPAYKLHIKNHLIPALEKALDDIDPIMSDKIIESIHDITNNILGFAGDIFHNAWSYTVSTIGVAITISLIPILLLYLLKDWEYIISNVRAVIPEKYKNYCMKLILEINRLIFAYVSGQLSVCIILSIFYSIFLHLIGIEFALLLGFFSGFLSIIPFIGAFVSFVVTLALTIFSFGMLSAQAAYVVLLFVAGHVLENYIIAPRIIGNKIGLHPLWIIFAVFACGAVFGFVGFLLAIPIAGIVKILFSRIMRYYKKSTLYSG